MTPMATSQYDRQLRKILQRGQYIPPEKIDEAANLATQENKSLAQVLVERRIMEERDLIRAIAKEIKLPPIDLTRIRFEEAILECIPQDLASYYQVIPISKIGNLLTIAVANPFDIVKLDELKIVSGCELRMVISTEMTIKETISQAYDKSAKQMEEFMDSLGDISGSLEQVEVEEDEDIDLAEITGEKEGSPVVKLVNMIIFQAIKDKVSDIHIEPFEKRIRVRYRQDGVLKETINPPKRMHNSIVSRIKIMSGLDIAEKRIPQDGKFQLRVEGRQVDFRVSTLPMIHGEKVVLRILDSSSLALSLDTLGFEEKALNDIRTAIKNPYGMILVTGPTGSGKTTTLYSSLREILSVQDNVITVEDPVEYQIEGVNQVPINDKRGLTFAAALRSILRQDPDKIMIGELRDLETIEIAVKAALTGHLVLSTLHTNSAAASITRMIDMGVDPFLVSSTVILVAAQRLGRRLCQECKQPWEDWDKEELLRQGWLEEDFEKELHMFKPIGCNRCVFGFKGRFPILETLPMNTEIRKMILAGASEIDIHERAVEMGMQSLRRVAVLNVIKGVTSIEEVLRVTAGGH
ncbi:MAG: type IV-A pilus assembly ATPase PilB [Planctomycetota bacterium]|nr:MAG: type IV-A pilus assembly ATPase PilB [Planctomycetota bacterium]